VKSWGLGLSRGSANPEPSKKIFEIDVCANANFGHVFMLM